MANFIDVLDTQYSGPFSCTILAGALLEFFRFAIYNSVHDEHFAKHSYIPVVSTYWSLSVSKNRLVDTYISILRCLFDNPINVNKIIEQTSPDRTYVIKA